MTGMQYLETLSSQEGQRLFELYQEDCKLQEVNASVSDFAVWLEEEGYGELNADS